MKYTTKVSFEICTFYLTSTYLPITILNHSPSQTPKKSASPKMPCRSSNTTDPTCKPIVRRKENLKTTNSCSVSNNLLENSHRTSSVSSTISRIPMDREIFAPPPVSAFRCMES